MTPSVDRRILEAVQDQIKVARDGIGFDDTSLPIKFATLPFDPEKHQKYVEVVFIPNNPEDRYWSDGKQVYRGIFRIILHWPNDGAGPFEPMDIIGAIGGYFTKTLLADFVKITSRPKLMPILEQGSELLYPIGIRYSCHQ